MVTGVGVLPIRRPWGRIPAGAPPVTRGPVPPHQSHWHLVLVTAGAYGDDERHPSRDRRSHEGVTCDPGDPLVCACPDLIDT